MLCKAILWSKRQNKINGYTRQWVIEWQTSSKPRFWFLLKKSSNHLDRIQRRLELFHLDCTVCLRSLDPFYLVIYNFKNGSRLLGHTVMTRLDILKAEFKKCYLNYTYGFPPSLVLECAHGKIQFRQIAFYIGI